MDDNEETTSTPKGSLPSVLKDCVFLSVVVWLSFVSYVGGLGFYLDDWNFLSVFSNSGDQSVVGLFNSLYQAQPWARMRPLQLLNLAWLYRLFGTYPLGYHLINATVFNALIVLFYKTLRRLNQRRVLAVSLPLVYALLPHYSSDRFWVATFQANLCMALYFLSFNFDLLSLQATTTGFWWLRLGSILCMIGSLLAYEVSLPLFPLSLVVFWYCGRRRRAELTDRSSKTAVAAAMASSVFVLVGLAAFKAVMNERSGMKTGAVAFLNLSIRRFFDLGYTYYDGVYGLNLKRALLVNYFSYGINLPLVVERILRSWSSPGVVVLSLLIGILVTGYLLYLSIQPEIQPVSRTTWLKVSCAGLLVFFLGYAIFLATSDIRLTTTDHDNRTNIAAAVGVAMAFLGGVGWTSTLLPSDRLRKIGLAAGVGLLCASGNLVINASAAFWTKAYAEQKEVLSSIRQEFPTLPTGSTLILDGFCMHKGPAVVFRYSWDLEGALQTLYQDPSLRADLVAPRLKVSDHGLSAAIEGERMDYPYGENLCVFHYRRKEAFKLTDAGAARFYFQNVHPGYENAPDPEEARRAFKAFNPEPINVCH